MNPISAPSWLCDLGPVTSLQFSHLGNEYSRTFLERLFLWLKVICDVCVYQRTEKNLGG